MVCDPCLKRHGPKTPKVEIRNVKHAKFASEETECFEATVYIDGKKEGTARNDGHGGCNFYEPYQLQDKLDAIAKTLPDVDVPTSGKEKITIAQDADILIGELLNAHLEAKELKRLTKKQTLFRIKSETYQRGEWRTVKAPFSPAVKDYLTKKYGTDLDQILNEGGAL